MPKLYEYMGLVIFFYSNEHEPIHVHGRHGEREDKIEIILDKGIVTKLVYKNVNGKIPLKKREKEKFLQLTELFSDEIVQSWINYFVLHKKIISKKLAGNL